MKTKHIIVAMLTVFLFVTSILQAQQVQQTPYEKKMMEIASKYVPLLTGQSTKGMRQFEKDGVNSIMYKSPEDCESWIGLCFFTYSCSHSSAEVKKMQQRIDEELAQAKKLRTSVDEQRAKDRQNGKSVKPIAFSKTDAGFIQKRIKNEFAEWNDENMRSIVAKANTNELKGIFYQAFVDMCSEVIMQEIGGDLIYGAIPHHSFTLEYGDYSELTNTIPVTLRLIERPESEYETHNRDRILAHSNISVDEKPQGIFFDCRWSYVNNTLFPDDATLVNSNDYYIELPLLKKMTKKGLGDTYGKVVRTPESRSKRELGNPNNVGNYEVCLEVNERKDIIIEFDSLGIDNSYLKGEKFNYSERARNFIYYSKQLSRDFIDYQSQINNHYLYEFMKNSRYGCHLPSNMLNSLSFTSNNLENEYKRKKNELEKMYQTYVQEASDGMFTTYSDLFLNRHEFDSCQKLGYLSFKKLVNKRSELLSEDIRSLYQDRCKTDFPNINYKDYLSSPYQQNREEFYNKIVSYKNDKFSYSKIASAAVQSNKKMSKEWKKNGEYFSNEIEFFEAYTSNDYKAILKMKKKN